MPVSTADFYAYAQATGTPVPQSKKEQAALVPAVRQWRKSQLQQQRQENAPDLGDAVAWTGLSAGALAGLFLRKPANVRKVQDFVAKQKTSVQNFRRDVAQQLDPDAPAPSGRNTSSTTNLQDIQKTGADAKQEVDKLLERVDKKTTATSPDPWEGLSDVKPTEEIASAVDEQGNILLGSADDPLLLSAGTYTASPGSKAGQSVTQAQQLAEEALQTRQAAAGLGTPQVDKAAVAAAGQLGGIKIALQKQGLPDFEIDARIDRYASTGEPRFLDPAFNAETIPGGLEGFRRELQVENIQTNQRNQIVSGQYSIPEGELPVSLTAKSTVQDVKDGAFDPVAAELGLQEGSVQTVDPTQDFANRMLADVGLQQRTNEQFIKANQVFASKWDELARAGQVAPRVISRQVDMTDLNLPVDVQGKVTFGEVLAKNNPQALADIQQGIPVTLDVPYQVNKNKVIQNVQNNAFEIPGDPTSAVIRPELLSELDIYKESGTRLSGLRQDIFGGLSSTTLNPDGTVRVVNELEQYTQASNRESQRFFENVDPPDVNITPSYGEGSMKGRFPGGTATLPVSQPMYDISIETIPGKPGKPDRIGNVANFGTGRSEVTFTSSLPDSAIVGMTSSDPNIIMSQPIALNRLLNKKPIPPGKKIENIQEIAEPIGEAYQYGRKQLVHEATTEVVQAPLQVEILDTTGKLIETRKGSLRRSELAGMVNQIQNNIATENAAGGLLRERIEAFNKQNAATGQKMTKARATLEAQKISRQMNVPVNTVIKRVTNQLQPNYKNIAKVLQQDLMTQKNIRLPVLDSYSAYSFIDNIIGKPRDQVAKRRLGLLSRNDQKVASFIPADSILQETKQGQQKVVNIRDLSTKQNRVVAVETPDPNLSTVPMGAPTTDITTSAKRSADAQQFERVGWGDHDIVELKDFTEGELQAGYQSSVELGRSTPMGDARSPEKIAADWNRKRQSQGLSPNITIDQAKEFKEQSLLPVTGPGSDRKPKYTSGLTMAMGQQKFTPVDRASSTDVTQRINARLLKQGKQQIPDSGGTGVSLAQTFTPAEATNKANWTLRKTTANDLLAETVEDLTETRQDLATPFPRSNTFNKQQLRQNKQGVQGLATPSALWRQDGNAPTMDMFTNIETPQYNTPVAPSKTTLSPTAIEQAEFMGIDAMRRASKRSNKKRNK